MNRPQPTGPLWTLTGLLLPELMMSPEEPVVKKMPAQSFLNTPSAGLLPCTLCGKSACGRSHQVIWGAMASIRGSAAAASSAIAPP